MKIQVLRALAGASLLAATIMAPGCYTTEANLPGTLRKDVRSEQVESVGKLSIEKANWFFFWGLAGDPPRDFFQGELKKQVQAKGGDGVSNLTYESQFGCVDLLITGATGGCLSPRSYKLSGDVVRIKAARIPGKPAKTVQVTEPPKDAVATAY